MAYGCDIEHKKLPPLEVVKRNNAIQVRNQMSPPERTDNAPKYRVGHVTHESAPRKLSGNIYGELDEESVIVATVKVDRDGYIPPDVVLRARIAPTIFTADIPYKALDRLESDDAVVAIELPRRLQPY